ncbi:MAG TPA: S-layer homology domain-containing protein [Negativicutes bacterium]
MKKSITILIVLVMICVANVVFAGPFADVPAKHWSYTAVNKLAQDGIIDGYGDGTFKGDKTITRYEMAVLVAKAMERTDKASTEDKALISKLSNEFAKELENLGVRVNTLEKKSEKFNIWGFLHVNDQVFNNSGVFKGASSTAGDTAYPNDGHYPNVGTDIYLTYKVNDKWNVKVEEEAVRGLRSGAYWSASTSDSVVAATERSHQIYAEGTIGKTGVRVGKFDYAPAYGLVLSAAHKAVNGIRISAGDRFKTTATYGYIRQPWAGNALSAYLISGQTDNHYAALAFDAALSKTTNFKAAYHNITNDGTDATVISDNIKLWEVGADTMLGKDLNLFASCARSNADSKNKAYVIGLTKGHADLNVPGTYSITARYLKADGYSSIAPDNYWISTYASTVDGIGTSGLKGPELNIQYMLDKNIGLMIWASSLSTTDGSQGKLKTIKTEFDFFF